MLSELSTDVQKIRGEKQMITRGEKQQYEYRNYWKRSSG